MIVQRLKAAIDQICSRVPMTRGRGEEATKQALVLPMLDVLGYDIWNPQEVCPEYGADFAVRKAGQKEKVDLAVLLDGHPRIYFEVKDVDNGLDGHEGQLARYFNATTSVSLGVLTNGAEYRFFTDTGDPNVMDSRPFHVFKIDAADRRLEILAKFHKSVFSPDAIRDFATDLNYTTAMAQFLRVELDLRDREASERLVRWILGAKRMYEGKVTINVVDRFRPIAKNALQIVLREIVRRSIVAMDKEVSSSSEEDRGESAEAPVAVADVPSGGVAQSADEQLSETAADVEKARIITTEKELECFAIVKELIGQSEIASASIFDRSSRTEVPVEIAYKDTTGYFGIYFNRPSWWVLRIVAEARQPWVGFNIDPEIGDELLRGSCARLSPYPFAEFRVPFREPDDLHGLRDLILASCKKIIADRDSTRPVHGKERRG